MDLKPLPKYVTWIEKIYHKCFLLPKGSRNDHAWGHYPCQQKEAWEKRPQCNRDKWWSKWRAAFGVRAQRQAYLTTPVLGARSRVICLEVKLVKCSLIHHWLTFYRSGGPLSLKLNYIMRKVREWMTRHWASHHFLPAFRSWWGDLGGQEKNWSISMLHVKKCLWNGLTLRSIIWFH